MKWTALILLIFPGCYNYRKAANQFGRASTSYPEIPAQYCAISYPVKEKIIPGKDSLIIDTLFVGGGEIIFDTIYRKDSVFFYTTERLPGSLITKTIYKTDTAYIENTAKLSLCELNKNKLIDLYAASSKELYQWKQKAKKRFLGIVALCTLLTFAIINLIKKKFKKYGL